MIYCLSNELKNSNQEYDLLDENYGGPLKSVLSILILQFYILFKKHKIIPDVFSGILKEGRYLMEVFLQSDHSNFLRNSRN